MKTLFFALALTPALALSQTTFECESTESGSKYHLLAKLNDAKVNLVGKTYTRAIVELSDTKETKKGCIVFTMQRQQQRLGYSIQYQADLSNLVRIKLEERSFTEEGPTTSVKGELVFDHNKPSVSRVPLTCVKH